MDCFAEPVIGRAPRDPLARDDGPGYIAAAATAADMAATSPQTP